MVTKLINLTVTMKDATPARGVNKSNVKILKAYEHYQHPNQKL